MKKRGKSTKNTIYLVQQPAFSNWVKELIRRKGGYKDEYWHSRMQNQVARSTFYNLKSGRENGRHTERVLRAFAAAFDLEIDELPGIKRLPIDNTHRDGKAEAVRNQGHLNTSIYTDQQGAKKVSPDHKMVLILAGLVVALIFTVLFLALDIPELVKGELSAVAGFNSQGMPAFCDTVLHSKGYTRRVNYSTLRTHDESGGELWQHYIEGMVVDWYIDDLNGDSSPETIIGVRDGGRDSGKIVVFDRLGAILWEYYPDFSRNYSGESVGRWIVNYFTVADLFNNGKKQVIVLYNDAKGFAPSCLHLIDCQGSFLGTYWHPGHLHQVEVGGMNRSSSEKRLLVRGINNRYSKSTEAGYTNVIFLLDPENIEGEAPPYRDHVERGPQLWYYLLGPQNTGLIAKEFGFRDYDGNGENEILIETNQHYRFYLDFNGNIVHQAATKGYENDTHPWLSRVKE